MRFLSSLNSLFRKTQGQTVDAAPAAPVVEPPNNCAAPAAQTVFLNAKAAPCLTESFEREITLLGADSSGRGHQPVIQKMKNGTEMTLNPDGSYVVRDANNIIVRTCDVMKVKREFARCPESGVLMVRRFGIWNKPNQATLDDSGNLFWQNNEVEVEERLNGLHVQRNRETGLMIQSHQKIQLEIVKMANGEVWRRQVNRDKESFAMWKRGKLSFKSETYFEAERHHCETPNGLQMLTHVSRFEESWSGGVRTREKYTFRSPLSAEKSVPIILSFSSGSLTLRNVESVVSTFSEGEITETIYHLKQAMNISIDIPGTKTTLEDIVRLRNFKNGNTVALSFETESGKQYIVFAGNKEVSPNRPLHQRPADDGYGLSSQPADLVLA